jgi:hypothetical protein
VGTPETSAYPPTPLLLTSLAVRRGPEPEGQRRLRGWLEGWWCELVVLACPECEKPLLASAGSAANTPIAGVTGVVLAGRAKLGSDALVAGKVLNVAGTTKETDDRFENGRLYEREIRITYFPELASARR